MLLFLGFVVGCLGGMWMWVLLLVIVGSYCGVLLVFLRFFLGFLVRMGVNGSFEVLFINFVWNFVLFVLLFLDLFLVFFSVIFIFFVSWYLYFYERKRDGDVIYVGV